MNVQEQEERDFQPSSASEWDQADAREKGRDNPNVCWIISDRDVVYRNPFYIGTPVRHPDDPADDDDGYDPHDAADEDQRKYAEPLGAPGDYPSMYDDIPF